MQVIAVLLKTVVGGVFVVLFSALGDALNPKAFAGLFSAAPSVALASLLVTTMTGGPSSAALSSRGMVAGAVGMIAYCVAAAGLVKRFGAGMGSVLAWIAWAVTAFVAFWVFIR